MSHAHFPSTHHPGDWLTVERAALENNLPAELLARAIQDGALSVQIACGARVVKRYEAKAWALKFKADAKECSLCED